MDKTNQDKWKALATIKSFDLGQHWVKKWKDLRTCSKRDKKRWKWAKQMMSLDDCELIQLKKRSNMDNKEDSVINNENPTPMPDRDSDKVVQYLRDENLKRTKSCDTCNMFQIYGKSLKDMPSRMQHLLLEELAMLFAKYEFRVLKDYGEKISSTNTSDQNPIINLDNLTSASTPSEALRTSDGSGITRHSHHESVFPQSMQQIDIINSATTTPISLLVQSLVKQLCSLLEKDDIRANQLYNTICEKLHSMNLIDDSYSMGEFEAMRSQYQRALYQLVAVANGTEIPINLPITWPIVEPSGLEWSRYHREFEELFFIAGGGFGSVFKARHRLDGVEYAIKKVFIKSSDVNSIMLHLSEVKTIASLSHPNIVNYKAAWLEPMVESNMKKKHRFQMDTDNEDFSSDIISSVQPNVIRSFKTHNSNELKRDKSLSDLIISFKNSDSLNLEPEFEQNDSSSSIEDLEDSDEESTSPEEENAVAKFYSSLECEKIKCSRVNLKWATLFIQMTFCQQTLGQWLSKRNHHMDLSRKGSEDFTLHHSDSTESACLNSPDWTFPINCTHLEVLIDMFTQLVKGLHYIHSRGIIHHDIKPSNVFVARNEEGFLVQLGDFGLACPLQQNHSGHPLGTQLYAAPEQLEGQCNPKSDMYSLGIILLEMVEPFSTDMERHKTITDLRKGQIPAHLTANHPKIAHIIGKLVQRRPIKRLDTAQLLEELKNLAENKDETIKLLREELAAKDDEIVKLKMMLAKFNNQ